MRPFRPADYGPVLAPLVGGDRCRALDRGRSDPSLRRALELATVEAAFAHAPLADRDMAAACLAGMWLVHDFLDESHALSQHIDTPSGAFWHGIMHRREGDFANAKYWFRRAGAHPVLEELGAAAAEWQHEPHVGPFAARAASRGPLDPFAFVDMCEAAQRDRGSAADFCRRMQQTEWEFLFDHCYRGAVSE